MTAATTRISPMSPQKRKPLNPAKLNERFGLHFQGLIEAAGLTVGELQERMTSAGQKISKQGIRHWCRGDAFPSPFAMEALAKIFNLPDVEDYRHVLPPPYKKPKKK